MDGKQIETLTYHYEETFRGLPFWLKAGAYGSINTLVIYPHDSSGESKLTKKDEPERARSIPEKRLLLLDESVVHQPTPYSLAEELVHALDHIVFFVGTREHNRQEFFSDFSYWREAVLKDLSTLATNPDMQHVVEQYLTRTTNKTNTCFHLRPSARDFYAEALADFVRIEMMINHDSGLPEPGATFEAQRRMREMFEHMSTVYYDHPRSHMIDSADIGSSTVVKRYRNGAITIGRENKPLGRASSLPKEEKGQYSILETFRELCYGAACRDTDHIYIPPALITKRDRKSPEYSQYAGLVGREIPDFKHYKAHIVLDGNWQHSVP